MKRAGVVLLVLWFLINACAFLGPRSPLQTAAPTPAPAANTPMPVAGPVTSPTASAAPASSPTSGPTDTPAPSLTPLPSPTPVPSGIEPESLSSLAQLHAFLPFNLNNLGGLMPAPGQSVDLNSIMSSMLPRVYFAMAYSPDGQMLALGGCTQMAGGVGYACLSPGKPVLRLMDAQTGKIIYDLTGPTSSITGLVFSRDGKTLVSASEASDGLIRFWDVSNGSVLRTISINSKNGAPALAISPDGNLLAAAWNENFRVWDFNSGKVVAQGVSSNGIPAFSQDGSLMAVYGAADRSSIVVYTTADWQPAMKISLPAQTGQFALSPDGKILVTGGDNNSGILHFWDMSSGKELGHVEDNMVPYSIAFSPDGRLLVTGGAPINPKASIPLKVMSVWNPQARQKLTDVLAPEVSPRIMVMSQDGHQIAFADMGGTVYVWGLADDRVTMAKQVLLTYLDDLNQGKYTDAAGLYYSNQVDPKSPDYQFLKKSHPQLDLSNVPGVLQATCEDKRFPCAKFRDVVFQGDMNGLGISFYVEYAAPDGSALASPIPCTQIGTTCAPTTAFLFSLMKSDSGEYKLVSLPPAADFP